MLRKTPMLFAGVFLATVACSGVDSVGNGIDATDITASAYRLSSGQTLHVSPENATVAVGATVKLSTIVSSSSGQTLSANGNLSAKWMSSDTTIARVSGSGSVVGVRNGVATITATASGQTSAANVTVGTGASTTTTTTPTTSTTTTQPVTGSSTTSTSTTTPTTTPTTTTTSTTSTTTAPAPAPAPASSNSTGVGLSGKAFVSDDFRQYSSTTDLFNNISTVAGGGGVWGQALYWDGHNANLATLDQTVLYNGHPTMKYNQPGGSSATPELWVNFANGKTLSTYWFRAKLRFSQGFTTAGTLTNSANAYKLLGFGWSGYNGRGSLEITNTTEYQLYADADNGTGTSTVPFQMSVAGSISTEWSDNGWYDYIIEYRVLSSTSAVERVWITKDGQTPVLRSTTNITGSVMPKVSSTMLGLNFNQVRTASQSQALWYGQWEVVDGSQYPNPFGLSVY